MPRLSLITLFHNRRDLAQAFLQQWQRPGALPDDVELLWGDNASTDGTAEWLATATGWARVVRFVTNDGYAAGNNRLAELARGDVLVFLNYDVVLPPGWLTELRAVLEARPDVGLVGNVQLSVRTRQVDHAGIFFDAAGRPAHFRPPLAGLARLGWLPVPAVTGACLAVRREWWVRLAGFDPQFLNGYEDVDLCVRARAAGAEVLVATRSVIWHYISASPGRYVHEAANEARFLRLRGGEAAQLGRWQPPEWVPAEAAVPAWVGHYGSLQVYYPQAGQLSEEQSRSVLYERGRWVRVQVPVVPAADGSLPLRLDPDGAAGVWRLGGVVVRRAGTGQLCWQAAGEKLRALVQAGGTSRPVAVARGVAIESTGDDPQLHVRIPAEVWAQVQGGWVEIWLRHELPAEPVAVAGGASTPPAQLVVGVDVWRLQAGGDNGGVKVLVRELLRALSTRPGLALTLVARPELAAEWQAELPACRWRPLSEDEYRGEVGRRVTGDWAVLYAPLGFSLLSRAGLAQVSLVVDLLHRDMPGSLPAAEEAFRERWLVESLVRSQVVQCNSHFVAERLQWHYGVSPASLCVVYNAVQARRPVAESEIARPYFLYPANDWPHKNHRRLLEAYARYRQSVPQPWSLCLTGAWQDRAALVQHVESLGLSGTVELAGFVEETDYWRRLSEAGALIFPSLYEGFGIPVAEAMVLGVPVLCSRRASLPEVGGAACGYFDPEDVNAMAAALCRMTLDPVARREWGARGRARVQAFVWADEVDKLVAAFRLAAMGEGTGQKPA